MDLGDLAAVVLVQVVLVKEGDVGGDGVGMGEQGVEVEVDTRGGTFGME